MAYEEKLASMWRQQLDGLDSVSEKKMMGGLCFLLNGNMLGTTRNNYFMDLSVCPPGTVVQLQ